MKKINSKKAASLATNKLIAIILVLFVILFVLILIFRVQILEWLRDLPGYSYDEEDKEVTISDKDREGAGICPAELIAGHVGKPEGKIGFRERYIYVAKEGKLWKTGLYWRGDEREGKIYALKKDLLWGLDRIKWDIEVAEVKNGIISVHDKFFDLGGEDFQNIRFLVKAEDLVKLHKSYYIADNWLCKKEKIEVELKPTWPETTTSGLKLIFLKTQDLKLEKYENGKHKIELSPYVLVTGNSKINYLYLINHAGYIDIKGEVNNWFDWKELGRIYPDGSVWLDSDRLSEAKAPAYLTEEFQIRFNRNYEPYNGESNLRVNYQEVRKFAEQ